MSKPFSSKKAIELSFRKIVVILIIVIVLIFMFPSIAKSMSLTKDGVSSFERAGWQQNYDIQCKTSNTDACSMIIQTCPKPNEEKGCEEEDVTLYKAYLEVTDCDLEDDCTDEQKEAWTKFIEEYDLKTKDTTTNNNNNNNQNPDGTTNNNNQNPDGTTNNNNDYTSPDYATFKTLINKKYPTLEDSFLEKTYEIAQELGTKPEYLIAVMDFETGASFDPCKRNSIGATGLIQFTKTNAEYLGTSTTELCVMSRTQQLDYVKKHYEMSNKAELDSLEDVYMAVYLPSAVGKDPQYKLPDKYYNGNKGLDINKDGSITVTEATSYVQKRYNEMIS